MHEILIEMPQLKQMKKEADKIIANGGTEQPDFNNAQLIHLDSLHDIANRDKAKMLRGVRETILNRKERIYKTVHEQDVNYDLVDNQTTSAQKLSKNAAIIKRFQQQSIEAADNAEQLESNFDWHDCL